MPSKKTRKSKKQRGGVKIGEGALGAVYRPPLLCNTTRAINNSLKTNNYIGKYTGRNVGQREKNKSNLVRDLNRNGEYTVTVNEMCELAPNQTNTNFENRPNREIQLISKYAGTSVEDLIPEDKILDDPEVYVHLTPEDIHKFYEGLRAIKSLAPRLREFNEHFIHNDLHFGNIVWDGTTARLIDFSELETLPEAIARLEEQYPDASEDEIETAAKSTDVARLYGLVKDILSTKFIMNTPEQKDRFRAWQFGHPYKIRDIDTYYRRLESLPV